MSEKLPVNTKKDVALVALLSGQNHEEAAAAAGVDSRTIRRWLRDEQFTAVLQGLRRQRLARVLNKLGAHQEKAADTLGEIVSDVEQPPRARIAAAKLLIDPALSFQSEVPVLEFIAYMRGAAGEKQK